MFVTKRSQRLGDLAAGTVVVRERRAPLPQELVLNTRPEVGAALPVDAAAIGERDYDVVRSFLQRRGSLEEPARAALARQVADAVRHRLGVTSGRDVSDEAFLESVAHAYRQRFAGPRR
jgi:hypothetical protein